MPAKSVPCPKCGRQLASMGVVTVDGGPECPVYQCDTCTVMGEVFGEPFEMAVTFAIDENGRVFDPNAPDKSPFPEPSNN